MPVHNLTPSAIVSIYVTHMRLYTSSACFSVLCKNQLFGIWDLEKCLL